MNVQQRGAGAGARRLRKFVSEWICPSCSLARSKRALSTSSTRDSGAGSDVSINKAKSHPVRRVWGEKAPNIVFSLIQPTGVPHLGNYLGAIRRWKELEQEASTSDRTKAELFFGLADLHSLTSNQTSLERRQNVKETFAALLALGLGTSKGQERNLFVQSQVPAHTELMWILSTVTSTGSLSRMVQWKEKSGETTYTNSPYPKKNDPVERLKLGLFSYPVLQAADVLLYHATHVPVGEDQAQHIELTRTIARAFNSRFNVPVFREPSVMISPARRVMSLQDPSKKMSKSDPDVMSRILVTDAPGVIQAKMKAAKTDSIEGITYDPEKRPGVANMIDILKYVTKSDLSGEEIAAEHANMRFLNFKMMIADEIIKELEGVGELFDEVMVGDDLLRWKMEKGNDRARKQAEHNMARIRKAVGLDYPAMISPD